MDHDFDRQRSHDGRAPTAEHTEQHGLSATEVR
jgi:hypothetical protein